MLYSTDNSLRKTLKNSFVNPLGPGYLLSLPLCITLSSSSIVKSLSNSFLFPPVTAAFVGCHLRTPKQPDPIYEFLLGLGFVNIPQPSLQLCPHILDRIEVR